MDKRSFLKEAGAASLAASVLLASKSSQAQAPASQVKVLIAYHSVTGNTEKMAQGVSDGAKSVADTTVDLKRVNDVATEDLLSADAVIVGSPVYFGNVSGEVKAFLDNWFLKFGVFRDAKMRNKVAGAFVTGAAISNGKETAMQAIHAALLMNQMVIVSAGGAFGAYGASATTGPDSPGIDDKKLEAARALGKRVAEFAAVIQRGSRA
ncbi:flavodoxin family protein [Bradyrhizobium liaoningense]|uniref:flavodoxin family protein n=1 Tax=Bradyrhizobium liaoningense TaxID=43992 RepID=UPI001BAE1B44|nr:NAD(P)H-dependent oxidoreductase [Bradyrhizobium liaoningense]MBR0717217.1 NAD(P)H-dependent oxidoreductase [Bradyrhizobium liaoningense]